MITYNSLNFIIFLRNKNAFSKSFFNSSRNVFEMNYNEWIYCIFLWTCFKSTISRFLDKNQCLCSHYFFSMLVLFFLTDVLENLSPISMNDHAFPQRFISNALGLLPSWDVTITTKILPQKENSKYQIVGYISIIVIKN